MTANPLMLRQPARPGRVTLEMLEELAGRLNKMRWVRESGRPYFIGKRPDDKLGTIHFLDRAA